MAVRSSDIETVLKTFEGKSKDEIDRLIDIAKRKNEALEKEKARAKEINDAKLEAAKKEREYKENVKKAREKFLPAYLNYLETLLCEELTPEDANSITKSLISIENKYAILFKEYFNKDKKETDFEKLLRLFNY